VGPAVLRRHALRGRQGHRSGNVQGGSTLATQIEKFRHSPEGRTAGGIDKLRQIFSASLRAYRDGTDTRATRREIILDYVNSMPLGAATGEVRSPVSGRGCGPGSPSARRMSFAT
jgi:membrane peptidoglycan carboxypeptidase